MESQKQSCSDFAKNNGYEIKKVFHEEGRSGRTTDRPAFKELMSEVKANPVDAIIILKIDRLARNVADFANIRKEIKLYGN